MTNIEQALNRINWRMTNEKFTPNEKDKEAVNFLSEWVKQQKAESIKENLLFAKIFCYAFKNEISVFSCPKISSRKIQEQLDLPIEHHYEQIHSLLNSIALEEYKKEIGWINKPPVFRTEAENEHNNQLLKTHKETLTKVATGTWTEKAVYSSLNNEITELINKYKTKM